MFKVGTLLKRAEFLFNYADKLQIPFVAIIGEEELNSSKVKVKNMATGKEVLLDCEAKVIKEYIKK